MMGSHLTERAIEALANERADLASAAEREHAASCATCSAAIDDARALSHTTRLAMRAERVPEVDLDALVALAMDGASRAAGAAAAPVPRASRRSLAAAAAAALAIVIGLGALAWDVPRLASMLSALRDTGSAVATIARVALGAVPGGSAVVALVGAMVVALLTLAMRSVVASSAHRHAGAGGTFFHTLWLGLLVAALVLGPRATAAALDFEGDWPANDRPVTLDVESQPASRALREAAQAAGVSLVATLPNDPIVSVHADGLPLRDVIGAVLGDAPLVARRTGSLVVIRPVLDAPGQPVSPPPPVIAPPVPPVPPPPPSATADDDRRVRDRVSFGGDVLVRRGERVRDLVTMGGDAVVEGEVLGDAVTMGGDLHVKPGGAVRGDLVTMGGDVTVDEGATVEGQRVGMPGATKRVRVDLGDDDDDDGDEASDRGGLPAWLRGALGTAARYALLFLLGLFLLGAMPERLAALERSVVRSPGRALATGLLGFVASVVLVVVLVITIIGIPAALVVLLAVPIGAYVGLAAVAATLGAALPIAALKERPVLQLAAGVLALFVASLVPFAGTIAIVLATALGLGAILLTRFGKSAPGDGAP